MSFRLMKRRAWIALVLCLSVSGPWVTASAQAPSNLPLPVADYVARGALLDAALSDDGKRLAALSQVGKKFNLVVVDLETMRPKAVTGFNHFDVVDFEWVGDWLVFSLGSLSDPTGPSRGGGGGLFTVRHDGTGARQLHPTVAEQVGGGGYVVRQLSLVGVPKGSDREIIASGGLRNVRSPDLYRINLETGAKVLLTQRHPGNVVRWLLDAEGEPRLAVVRTDEDEKLLGHEMEFHWLYRDSSKDEWRKIYVSPKGERERVNPLAFAEDGRNLLVSSRKGRNTTAVFAFDVSKGELGEMLAGHPRYDMGGGLLRDAERRVIGVTLFDETRQTAYFNEAAAALQASLEASFPGQAVEFQWTRSDRALVSVYSDRSPRVYYLFDRKLRRLTELTRTNDKLDERHLVSQRPFLLKTRDGLEIPSYYFLPASYQPGQKLPLVVHVHGGPFARPDLWGWGNGFGVMEAQILASRGYAVVLPNFRITPGLGKKIYDIGFGEAYGTTMSEDHEDAAMWAVAQGFADKERICISGASYGGYAAMWGLIKSSHIFKCGVAGLVVSDLQTQLTSLAGDTAYNPAGQRFWKEEVLGIKADQGWERAHAVSPARHVDKLKGALFMYAGRDDQRTPIEQTLKMVEALKAVGKAPEVLMIKPDEGHGYADPKNREDLYVQMLKFLDRHIGQNLPR